MEKDIINFLLNLDSQGGIVIIYVGETGVINS